jgi:hypothetical protein
MSGNAAAVLTKPAFRKIERLARDIAVERRPDGVIPTFAQTTTNNENLTQPG